MRWFEFETEAGKKVQIQAATRREAAKIFMKEFVK